VTKIRVPIFRPQRPIVGERIFDSATDGPPGAGGGILHVGSKSGIGGCEAGEFAARVLGPALAGLIAVGPEAAPLLDGARQIRSWHGEALGVPDGPAVLAVLADRLKPGDVVLVKASREVRLEGVAEELLLEADR